MEHVLASTTANGSERSTAAKLRSESQMEGLRP
jgi:hypothetical protein